jgi:hypothetical protein
MNQAVFLPLLLGSLQLAETLRVIGLSGLLSYPG